MIGWVPGWVTAGGGPPGGPPDPRGKPLFRARLGKTLTPPAQRKRPGGGLEKVPQPGSAGSGPLAAVHIGEGFIRPQTLRQDSCRKSKSRPAGHVTRSTYFRADTPLWSLSPNLPCNISYQGVFNRWADKNGRICQPAPPAACAIKGRHGVGRGSLGANIGHEVAGMRLRA